MDFGKIEKFQTVKRLNAYDYDNFGVIVMNLICSRTQSIRLVFTHKLFFNSFLFFSTG